MSALRKPTENYKRLMESFAMNEEAERIAIQEKAAKKKVEKKKDDDHYSFIEKLRGNLHSSSKKVKAHESYIELKSQVTETVLESCLSSIVQKCLPKVIVEDNKQFISSIVSGFVQKENAYTILDNMNGKTLLLSELATLIKEAVDEELEPVNPDEDIEAMPIDNTPEKDLISKIEGDEEINDIADIIKSKVSRATEEFMANNVINQTDIKDTLADTRLRMDKVNTGDDAVDEEIRQEAYIKAHRQVEKIRNGRPRGVFEQLVINMTEAVMKNDKTREAYTIQESGRLNVGGIVDKCKCIYTLMETVNTLKIKKLNEKDIIDSITFK